MRLGPVVTGFVVVTSLLAACTTSPPPETRVGPNPFPWDEEAPERSELAKTVSYSISQSSSFLVKDASYARYILRIESRVENVSVFFTTTNQYTPTARHPSINDTVYHYEFMQLRRLGQRVRVMDVNAEPAFSNANTGKTLTLAFIYGKGANFQYFVPYEGDPAAWTLEPGYYELIIATDEKLVVGVNLDLHTPLWTTHYHPQELGDSHAETMRSYGRLFAAGSPRSLHEGFDEVVDVPAEESLHYFAFANLIYRSHQAAIGAQGLVRVQVDEQEVPHRFEATHVNATSTQRSEAFAYAVSFNEAGPARHRIQTRLDFDETVSYESDLVAKLLIFAVATEARQAIEGIPTETPSA